MASTIDETLSYDEAFTRLEAVLGMLENDDLPLEKALTLYEEGAALATFCANRLEQAELRVRQWQPGDVLTSFEGWQDS